MLLKTVLWEIIDLTLNVPNAKVVLKIVKNVKMEKLVTNVKKEPVILETNVLTHLKETPSNVDPMNTFSKKMLKNVQAVSRIVPSEPFSTK